MSGSSVTARAHQVRATCQLFADDEITLTALWVLRGTGARLLRETTELRPTGVRLRWTTADNRGCVLAVDEDGACWTTPASWRRIGATPGAPWAGADRATLDAAARAIVVERRVQGLAIGVVALALLAVATIAATATEVALAGCIAAIALAAGEAARRSGSDDPSIRVAPTPETAERLRERLAALYAVARERLTRIESLAGE